MSTVGIIVPAYRPNVPRLAAYVEDLVSAIDPAAIRIELDAPGPGVVDELVELPATVNVSEHRRGKGAAITAGLEALETERLAFADADGSTPADDIAEIVAALDYADVSVGSRRHPDADIVENQSVVRSTMGDAFAWLARRALTPQLTDYQCGAKAVTQDTWQCVRQYLCQEGFAWDFELVAYADAFGQRILEVPVSWVDRPDSTVHPIWTPLELGRALLTVRHRAKVLGGDRLHRLVGLGAFEFGRTTPLLERRK